MEQISVTCAIAGGGPAGMMLGFLLARAGVSVVVLEKHADFLRDFRGDTIHPATLEVMHELGLLDDFLKRPHQELRQLKAEVGDTQLQVADFSRLRTRCKFVAFMPQWDFLDFLANQGRRFPGFQLKMESEVTGIIEKDGRVIGLKAKTSQGELEVYADLNIAADGRHSVVRTKAGLEVLNLGAPMDVLWMRVSKHANDPEQTFGKIDAGRFFIMFDRADYWQCAFVIPKGSFGELREKGIAALREEIVQLESFLRDRVGELRDWDDVSLLTVAVDRLRQWYRSGLLCIGDAAHAMSPVGGVGINLAIQDAVASANILTPALTRNHVVIEDLERVQRRRELPTRVTQRVQMLIQDRVIRRVLTAERVNQKPKPPFVIKLVSRWPFLQTITARFIGIGFRPEHLKSLHPQAARPVSSGRSGLATG